MAESRRIVREVAAAVGLAEGERGVDAVISTLARLEPVSIRRVSRATELPVPIVASVCGELRKRAVVAEERPARLTDAGRALFAHGELSLPAAIACRRCRGRAVVIPNELHDVVRDVARSARAAPSPRLELDQCHCTVETKVHRVLALHAADALVGKRVLLLGDDDLVALAIASVVRRFGSATTVARLAVVDVDTRILELVASGLDGSAFRWTCVEHDLRAPLPASLARGFDTVVTDPPYTAAAARLFLSRAAEALAGSGDVFLSFGSKRPGAAQGLQRVIADHGFLIRSLTRDFNEYVGAGVIGGTSHLYHLAATDDTRPLVGEHYTGALYTAET